jgi:ubiquinone/menaquinone biosynthesis C-methylase UbiE
MYTTKYLHITVKDGIAKIDRPLENCSDSFKATYNRFVVEGCSSSLLGKAREYTNKLQSQSYSKEPTAMAKFLSWVYTPAPKIDKGGNLLDVGCSTGVFISHLGEIWDPVGLEINHSASQIAISKGLKVINKPFNMLPEKDLYNVVRCSHVIEHIKDYENFIQKISRIMEPGGSLVIYTPNLDSYSRLLFGRSWEGYNDETHFNIFNKKALADLGKKYELELCESKTYFMGYMVPSLLNLLMINSTHFVKVLTVILSLIIFPIELFLSKLQFGDALYIRFIKR